MLNVQHFLTLCVGLVIAGGLPDAMRERAETFYVQINWRKAISEFSSEAIPRDVIETCVLAVGTAPSDLPTNPGTLQWCKATLLQCPENEKP